MKCPCGNPAKVLVEKEPYCWCCYRRLRGWSEGRIKEECPIDEKFERKQNDSF